MSGPDANGAGAPRELPAGAGRSPESLTGIVRCLHEPPRQPQAVNADTGSALQMRRSNIREVKSLRQRHTATKWQPQARCQSGLVTLTTGLIELAYFRGIRGGHFSDKEEHRNCH